MDKILLVALVDSMIEDAINKIEIPEGPQGPRGLRGKDGNDFNLSDHKEAIEELIKSNLPTDITLTVEQLESLQGCDGKDGKDGKSVYPEDVLPEIENFISSTISEMKESLKLKFSDLTEEERLSLKGARGQKGKQGKDFSLDENLEGISAILKSHVESLRESLKLKIEDLSPEELESIRGEKGRDGKDGLDFSFQENSENISGLIQEYINSIRENLTLKFEDLTPDEVESLRGKRGLKGADGSSFVWEENSKEIQNQIIEYINSVRDSLKLYFSDLTEEEKLSLKLKFSDLTDDEKASLKGPRGQRGKAGYDGKDGLSAYELALDSGFQGSLEEWVTSLKGDKGERGERGIQGLPGVSGLNGKDGVGKDGKDGKDAPRIVGLEIESDKEYFSLTLSLEDGEEITTNEVKFPASQVNNYYTTGGGYSSGTGGTGTANPTEYFDEGITIGTAEKVNFSGPNVTATKVGDRVEVVITDTDTNTTDLKVFNGALTPVVITDEIEFSSTDFTVTDNAGRAVVSLKPITAAPDLGIYDEYNLVTPTAKNINFVGDYVTVRQRVPIAEWSTLSGVTPDMASYLGNGVSDAVDVFIDVPDSSLLKNVTCLSDVYVGSFVIINSSETAINALADSYVNSNVIGLVESKSSPTVCDIRVSGISSAIFSGLDTSLDYYLSDTVAGGISNSVPTTSGHVKLKLGQAFGATKFLFSKGERVVRL